MILQKELLELSRDCCVPGYTIDRDWVIGHILRAIQSIPPVDRWLTKISMDLSTAELLFMSPVKRDLIHQFSDSSSEVVQIPCYSIEEILSEKFRALVERKYTSPRDYYDLWYISNTRHEIDWKLVSKIFVQKCHYKGISLPESNQIITDNRKKVLEKHWRNHLEYLMPGSKIPDLNLVIGEVQTLIDLIAFHR